MQRKRSVMGVGTREAGIKMEEQASEEKIGWKPPYKKRKEQRNVLQVLFLMYLHEQLYGAPILLITSALHR